MTAGRPARRTAGTTFGAALLCGATALWASGAAAQVYLQAGVDVALAAGTQFTDVECESTMPAALYGCGAGEDGAPLRSAGEFRTAAGLALAVGYAIAPAVSVEVAVEYRADAPFAGRANFLEPAREQSVAVERSSLSASMAVKIGLQALGAPTLGGFRPFVGAGLGRVRHRTGETRMTFPRTETAVPGASRTDWTWTVTVGASRALGERTSVELAWRYADRGDARTGTGAGRVEWRDGSRTIPLELAPTRAQVSHHGVRLSVRYAL